MSPKKGNGYKKDAKATALTSEETKPIETEETVEPTPSTDLPDETTTISELTNPLADVPSSSTEPPVQNVDGIIVSVMQMNDEEFQQWLTNHNVEDLTITIADMKPSLVKLGGRFVTMQKTLKESSKETQKQETEERKKQRALEKKEASRTDREAVIRITVNYGNRQVVIETQKKSTVGDFRKKLMMALGLSLSNALRCRVRFNGQTLSDQPRATLKHFNVSDGCVFDACLMTADTDPSTTVLVEATT